MILGRSCAAAKAGRVPAISINAFFFFIDILGLYCPIRKYSQYKLDGKEKTYFSQKNSGG
jgi:hypothetical protein